MVMPSTSNLLIALVAGARLAATASASTYSGSPFRIGNGQSFGIPGNATYDYVVVGGGTAGLAMAMRLAEDGTHSVAVVEAGGFYQVEAGNKSVVSTDRVLSYQQFLMKLRCRLTIRSSRACNRQMLIL